MVLGGGFSLVQCAREWQLNRTAANWTAVRGVVEQAWVTEQHDWLRGLFGPPPDDIYLPIRTTPQPESWADRVARAALRFEVQVRYRLTVDGVEVLDDAPAPLGLAGGLRSRSAAEVIAGTFQAGEPIAVYVRPDAPDLHRLDPAEVSQARLTPWALGSALLVLAGALGLRNAAARPKSRPWQSL